MSHLKIVSLLLLVMLMGCKSTCVHTQTTSQLIDNNPRFVDLLSEKQIAIMEGLVSVDLYNIQSYLIEGTENEYSKKSVFVRTLSDKEKTTFLNMIINDAHYNWENEETINYHPNIQFLLKGTDEQFLLLYSESSQEVGIIDLEGQKTVSVQSKLNKFLITK